MKEPIRMVDLKREYLENKEDIDRALQEVLDLTAFIKGPAVKALEKSIEDFLNVEHCITCGNGTDALQLALMSLNLKPGSEVIVPDFTFVASAEVIALMKLKPIFAPVCPDTFLLDLDWVEKHITKNTKVIIPVHLFGQCVDMERLMQLAHKNSFYVIEDNAQAFGAKIKVDNESVFAGTVAHLGTTSFFPSKILGCYGDGGAVFTADDALAQNIRCLANHGSETKYYHSQIGINSRLDTMQASVLLTKLKSIDQSISRRVEVAELYNALLSNSAEVVIPAGQTSSSHVYHQYTLKVKRRDELKAFLQDHGIPSMVYYPVPLHQQKAYAGFSTNPLNTLDLCNQVLSLPIHPYLTTEEIKFIVEKIIAFYEA